MGGFMETIYVWCKTIVFFLCGWMALTGCYSPNHEGYSHRVPEDLLLPAIDPVPEWIDPRNHPILPLVKEDAQ